MKHYFYLNFISYDEDGEEVGYRSGTLPADSYRVTAADIKKITDSVPGQTLHLLSVSYLGQMTQSEYEG
ncbi:hypothetical protein [Pseudomonas putida]|uniref:Uncharacterized protein n=1 Tax=Pseudomonas putida TaxID=303 RepID=A0AAW4C386_PSEPU|nr:hypothetical protein [Pseudomonas putida]MBF8704842.1 hypothetical protein [Pseudomonas putida]MBF8739182.1 hypothetical protein [Pseudomonas putida]